MFRLIGILVLMALLGACDKGVKPAAVSPPKVAPAVATKPTIDQTPELESDPRALYHAPPIAIGTTAVPREYETTVKTYFERTQAAAAAPRDGFTTTVNHSCPIMQKMKLNATTAVEHTVQFEGKAVGFCCDDCRDAWESMSDDERRTKLSMVVNKK